MELNNAAPVPTVLRNTNATVYYRSEGGSAYGPGSMGAQWALAALRKPRELCWELDILNDRWSGYWRRLGIWAPRGE